MAHFVGFVFLIVLHLGDALRRNRDKTSLYDARDCRDGKAGGSHCNGRFGEVR